MIRSLSSYMRSARLTSIVKTIWLLSVFMVPGSPLQANENREYLELSVHSRADGNPDNAKAVFRVELASDPDSFRLGLSGRPMLSENNGMLFILAPYERYQFWTKGMRFPIDIIFIDTNNMITRIFESLEPCSENCSLYETDKSTALVLELPAGTAKKSSLSTGDRISTGKNRARRISP